MELRQPVQATCRRKRKQKQTKRPSGYCTAASVHHCVTGPLPAIPPPSVPLPAVPLPAVVLPPVIRRGAPLPSVEQPDLDEQLPAWRIKTVWKSTLWVRELWAELLHRDLF